MNIESLHKKFQLTFGYYHFNIQEFKQINEKIDYLSLYEDIKNSGLYFSEEIICRFVSSLCTKRFLILTGLSGSGKTKLAQAFVKWISPDSDHYSIVTVGSDWTNREPLLGYPNAIEKGKYVKPHHDVVDLLIKASKNPDMPYFLVLDEMNLSHVERYFADFLSAMESNEAIQFHEGGLDDLWESDTGLKVPGEIRMPNNLFIIGTVNIDETTYMFSPKVLDRANVIEFRVDTKDIDEFLENPVKPDLETLEGKGADTARHFVQKAIKNNQFPDEQAKLKNILIEFFSKSKFVGAEFGYRTASEIMTLAANIKYFTEKQDKSWPLEKIADAAILQKLLPKLHGSRKKLSPVLENLAELCIDTDRELNIQNILTKRDGLENRNVKFPKSLEKIRRMYKRLMQNGFTSFTEA
jgi:5-methylcytosine-specific restriction protein B